MCPKKRNSGFTVVELLVVIAILVIIAGLTVGAMRGARNHQVLEQAASQLSMVLEYAKAHAVSGGESVYLVVSDHGTEPELAALRTYTLMRDRVGQDPEMLREWIILPRDIVFAEDPYPAQGLSRDLIAMDPIETRESPFGGQQDLVTGPVRLLVEIRPDGRFYTGEVPKPEPAHLVLQKGEWYRPAAGPVFLQAHPLDAVRVHLRPRTGVTRTERILLEAEAEEVE
ncbi:MAG: prepilin-type N-terminal cleavage/methylation domain-containing protein [Verrucomicrobia bacterium]|nr:prepilin-type N-terminal cleavage/methylation domain-containing protein [Verrucomicrobiota bacterium]MCH8510316.1 prepilin-type N-terminal cleavage/methylation domain-containing protein [Kiritimatiellia bacterium]